MHFDFNHNHNKAFASYLNHEFGYPTDKLERRSIRTMRREVKKVRHQYKKEELEKHKLSFMKKLDACAQALAEDHHAFENKLTLENMKFNDLKHT
jgi:hypothetical protein